MSGSATTTVVLDTEGLSLLAHGDPRMSLWLAALDRADAELYVSAVSLAEATDGSDRDVRVGRALRGVVVEDVDQAIGFQAGRLRKAAAGGRRKQRDLTVDAVVAATAVSLGERVVVLTLDPDDLSALLDGTSVRVEQV